MKLCYNKTNVLEYFFISDVIFLQRGIEIMSGYNKIIHIYVMGTSIFINYLFYKMKNNKSFVLMETLNETLFCLY